MSNFGVDGAVKMYYAYNGEGQQVRRYSSTSVLHSIYAEDGRWLGEYGDTGVAHQQVVWLDDLPVGVINRVSGTHKLFYVEPDHLGSPRVVVDPVRNLAVWKWELKGEAFGNTAPNEDPDMDGVKFVFDLRFPGQRYDAASRLNYNYFQNCESVTGRYSQSDPVGLSGGLGAYTYANGNSIIVSDPKGLCPCGNPQVAIDNARRDTRDWSRLADRSDINSGFGEETNKCNLFVDAIYEESGYSLPNFGGTFLSVMLSRYPPGAQTLSDSSYNLLGWPIISGVPQPGDLVASGGHVGIYAGGGMTISASTDRGVVENNWGFRVGQHPVIRRCACP